MAKYENTLVWPSHKPHILLRQWFQTSLHLQPFLLLPMQTGPLDINHSIHNFCYHIFLGYLIAIEHSLQTWLHTWPTIFLSYIFVTPDNSVIHWLGTSGIRGMQIIFFPTYY